MKPCPLDVSKISPRIYQGSAPPIGHQVSACGFDVLVLAAEEYQPAATEFPGVKVIHVPFDDALLTQREWHAAVLAAEKTARAVRDGSTALITCHAGLNRSGLVTALTLHMLTGQPGPQIVKHIQRRRQYSLNNGTFVKAIEELPATSFASSRTATIPRRRPG